MEEEEGLTGQFDPNAYLNPIQKFNVPSKQEVTTPIFNIDSNSFEALKPLNPKDQSSTVLKKINNIDTNQLVDPNTGKLTDPKNIKLLENKKGDAKTKKELNKLKFEKLSTIGALGAEAFSTIVGDKFKTKPTTNVENTVNSIRDAGINAAALS